MVKNNLLKVHILLLFITLTPYFLSAQFTLTGEVRPRSEFRNGFKTPTTATNDPVFFTEQRSRVYFDYKEEKYKFRFSLQDVRMWGENSQIFKEEDGNTFLSEAWGQYFFTPKFSAKFGRQIISYDNQRFLGGLEWAQQGRRHDAFLFLYEDDAKKTKFHVGLAINSDDDVAEPAYIQAEGASFYSVGGSYKSMQYAWFNQKFNGGSVSLLALNATYQNADSTNFSKQTLGALGKYDLGAVTVGGDFYYQMGKIGANDVDAMLAGINLTFKTKITPLKLGIEYISGKDNTDADNTTITNFSPDFGTNHAHNGFMDYFFVGPANGNVGVTDIYLKTKFKLKKGALTANFHEFLTGSTRLDALGDELSKPMGFEIDLVYGVPLTKGVKLNVGYSQMFGTETLIALRPGTEKLNNWAWMMVTFKPVLYKSKTEEK